MRTALLAALLVAATACQDAPPAEGHLTLFVETDAPLGDGGESLAPLFDTVRIELYRDGAVPCAECARDFPLSSQIAEPSITLTTGTTGAAIIAHVCIFRARWGCVTETSLETWVALPAVPATNGSDVTVSLLMESVGTATGTREAPVSSRPGRPQPLARWTGADHTPCATSAPDGRACIAGGAFWMGNPDVDNGLPSQVRRLVVTSPFFLDQTEVSVAGYRAIFGPSPIGVGHFSGTEHGSNIHDYCTFTDSAGPNDDLPINCLTWTAARAYCIQKGADLPTEVQFEMASAGPAGHLFVWGDDTPTCQDAVWGREDPGFAGVFGFTSNECVEATSRGLPLSTKRDAVGRDVLHLPDGDVRDLAGNVGEWMLDGFQQSGSCWTGHEVLYNPRCDVATDFGFGPTRSVRGGSWFLPRKYLTAALRNAEVGGGFVNNAGFRCASSAR